MRYPRNTNNLKNAKVLRKNMTRQERHLWYDFLRHYPVKFYKQRIIDNYIADFYCHAARLVIEIDGSQHYTTSGKVYDELRTERIEWYGLQVLRFSNRDVDENFESVCTLIDRIIRDALSPANAGALPEGEP